MGTVRRCSGVIACAAVLVAVMAAPASAASQKARIDAAIRQAFKTGGIRAVIVQDSDRIAERLDAAMQVSVDAYVDPWQEADRPATAGQFVSGVAGER